MALNIFSAVVVVDTRFQTDANLAGKTPKQKCDFLEQCATQAVQSFKQLNGGAPPSNAIQILLAPEYFFGLPVGGAGSAVNAYTETEKDEIVTTCAAISGRFPTLLMVPGTVLYKRRMGRDDRKKLAKEIKQGIAGFQGTRDKDGVSSNQLVKEGERGVQNIKLKGLGIKETLGLRDPRLFGYNCAFVYYGGAVIEELNKADNASEFAGENPKPTLVPGVGSNTFAHPTQAAVTLGLEVCADHGRLKAAGKSVDIQMLISASNPVSLGFVNPAAKVLINCDGGTQGSKFSGVYLTKTTGSDWQKVTDGRYLDLQGSRTANQQVALQGRVRAQLTQLP